MTTNALQQSMSELDPAQQRMTLALGIVLDRIQKLSREDCDDLFALVTDYRQATSNEDRTAADAGIMEILEQEDVSVQVKTLTVDGNASTPPNLTKWLDWVSRKIHALREKAGLSQVELADRTGLPQSHISRLENGKHSPSRYTLEKLAEAMGVDVAEFDPSAE